MNHKLCNKTAWTKPVMIVGLNLFLLSCFVSKAEEINNTKSIRSGASLPTLSFKQAINAAQKNDPWLTGNRHKQSAIESLSKAANTLPDPKMSIAIANLPTDTFDFTQEGMTQFKVGVSQMFPRGDTLAIRNQQLKIQSESYPFQRKNRTAKVAVSVGSLWLDTFRVQQSIALIEKNRSLFEQLADVAEASYSSTLGKTRQQDIVRSQLELTRLEDRLDQLAQQKNHFEGQLARWLIRVNETEGQLSSDRLDYRLQNIKLNSKLPEISLSHHSLIYSNKWHKPEQLVTYFANHPSVLEIDNKIKASKTGISLANQKYKPEWGLSASYAYRDDDPMGNNRADFFSVGITFDLPLFTNDRQDNQVKSAISETESIKTEKILLLRQLLSTYASAKGRLLRLNDRQALYQTKLLPQIQDQAEASLTAYTNDDGDFSEVVRSRIAVLNAEIDALSLNVEEQKIRLELNYLLLGNLNTAMTENNMNFTKSSQYAAISGEQ